MGIGDVHDFESVEFLSTSTVAAVDPDEGFPAANLIKDAARAVGGGGGGKGDLATAGGKDPAGLDEARRIAVEAATA